VVLIPRYGYTKDVSTTDNRTHPAGAAPETASWISKTPGVCGGQACVRNKRVTVWGLVAMRRFGLSDAQILRDIAGLTPEDLVAAWGYAAAHPNEIEAAIRLNDEAA
jgi:uncharacterized protein (DUF433 family)